jgi:hypothetical protein
MMRLTRPVHLSALVLVGQLMLAACVADDALEHGPSVRAALDAQRLAPVESAEPGMISARELEPAIERHLERRPPAPAAQR